MGKPRGHILCLEDNQDTRDLVNRMLQAEGYLVFAASSIAEAIRLIEREGFSLYIVDERLPDGNGIEFIRTVREAGSTVPILVHSAAAYKGDIDAAMAAGANDYVVKPNGWSRLLSVVTALILDYGDPVQQAGPGAQRGVRSPRAVL